MPLAGQLVRASDVPARMGCTLRRAAAQSIGDAVVSSLIFDTEDEDTHGFTAVPAAQVNIPAGCDGVYAVCFRVDCAGLAATRAFMQITPTSAFTGTPVDFRGLLDSAEDRGYVTATLRFAAGDNFLAQVFQDNAGNTALNFTGWLSCYRVSL